MITIPISLLVAHFIGDFLMQTDWMAINKSKSWWALHCHVAVYMLVVFPILAYYGVNPWIAAAVTYVTHFITDAVTSRITSKLWFMPIVQWLPHQTAEDCDIGQRAEIRVLDTRHWFFVMIGFDQLIHYVTLALTLRLLS